MNEDLVRLIADVLYDKPNERNESLAWFIAEALLNEPSLSTLLGQYQRVSGRLPSAPGH
jgi:hypothetical protein